jgi:phenylacetate-CoA ligase
MADAPCGCGNRMPRVAGIEGRTGDAFWVGHRGGYRRQLQEVFTKPFLCSREVREWQDVPEQRNRLSVWIEILPGSRFDRHRAETALHQGLREFGFDGLLNIRLEQVTALQADPGSRKVRRMVSQVESPGLQGTTAVTSLAELSEDPD